VAGFLFKLFAPSPFQPLIELQRQVLQCVEALPAAIDAALEGDEGKIKQCAKVLSQLEEEADASKTRLRDQLPSSLILPVNRADLLHVVSAQDSTADAAEDVGVLLTMRVLTCPPEEVVTLLRQLVESVISVTKQVTGAVEILEEVTQTSFSGAAAQRLLQELESVARAEHEADKVQDQLAKAFFRHEDLFKPSEILLWIRIFERIGAIANNAKKTAHRMRLFVATV
jgi:predicted phosphate transport protein (TIGR00153 family)